MVLQSPGKNTGVGCHFLLQCMKVKSEREVAQSCPTLSNPMDYSLPGPSVHGVFQAKVLEWLEAGERWARLAQARACPWDSPGKNTGVGCHFFLQCMKVKSESEVALSCPTLSDPMDCSLPGSSVHGIFQARVLEWGAIALGVPLGGTRRVGGLLGVAGRLSGSIHPGLTFPVSLWYPAQ